MAHREKARAQDADLSLLSGGPSGQHVRDDRLRDTRTSVDFIRACKPR